MIGTKTEQYKITSLTQLENSENFEINLGDSTWCSKNFGTKNSWFGDVVCSVQKSQGSMPEKDKTALHTLKLEEINHFKSCKNYENIPEN